MDELTKELNAVIGKIRAHREILSESRWVVAETISDCLLPANWYKAEILKALADIDLTLTTVVGKMHGIDLMVDSEFSGRAGEK